MMVIGDSGAGKTGGLVSLVDAGYKLRIVDMDNGLDALVAQVLHRCPDKIDNVEFVTFRDKKVPSPNGFVVEGSARAYLDACKATEKWTDGSIPWKWGPEHILVIDTGTTLGDAAYDWREQLTPRGKSGQYDGRAVYYDAQKSLKGLFATLTGEAYRTNVMVLTHVRWIEQDGGLMKGYPSTIGQALSPMIGLYFNTVLLVANQQGKRWVRTVSTHQIDLKNPKPFIMGPQYPLETGYADIFKVLRQQTQEVTPPPKPQHVAPQVRPQKLNLIRRT